MGSRHRPEKPTSMNVKTAMHVSEMVVCLVLLSWYSPILTAAVHVTGGFLLDFSRLLTRPLSVFLISNAIIVVVAVLSGDDTSIAAETKAAPELQTPSPAASELQTPSPAAAELQIPLPVAAELQIPLPAAADLQTPSPAAADTVTADEVTSSLFGELISNNQVATAAEEADDGKQRLQCPPESGAGEEQVRKNPVEDLSTEEFNLTVDKYIARTKSFLHKERLDDICKF